MSDLPLHDLAMSSPNVTDLPPGPRFRMMPEAEVLLTRIEELEAAYARLRADLAAVAEMTTRTAVKLVTERRR